MRTNIVIERKTKEHTNRGLWLSGTFWGLWDLTLHFDLPLSSCPHLRWLYWLPQGRSTIYTKEWTQSQSPLPTRRVEKKKKLTSVTVIIVQPCPVPSCHGWPCVGLFASLDLWNLASDNLLISLTFFSSERKKLTGDHDWTDFHWSRPIRRKGIKKIISM